MIVWSIHVMPVTIDSFFTRNGASPDKEQDFIDFFVKVAKNPGLRSKKMKSRRVAVFGKPYYWGSDVSFPIDKLPLSFRKWCAHYKYTDHNSFLINVYDDKKDNIGWHYDDVSNLEACEVISISFAMRKQDRGKVLSHFEFRWPKKDGEGTIVKSEDLKHGTAIRFDAKKHKKKLCEHRVAKTLVPRVNVTMRKLL